MAASAEAAAAESLNRFEAIARIGRVRLHRLQGGDEVGRRVRIRSLHDDLGDLDAELAGEQDLAVPVWTGSGSAARASTSQRRSAAGMSSVDPGIVREAEHEVVDRPDIPLDPVARAPRAEVADGRPRGARSGGRVGSPGGRACAIGVCVPLTGVR